MAQRERRQLLAPFTAFATGARSYSQIVSGMRTAWFTVVITATVTLAGGPATAIINGGNLAALFQFIGVEENGWDSALWPARMMSFFTKIISYGQTSDVGLTLLANGAYPLRSTIRIPYAWPLSGSPWETAYVERDPSQNTYVFLVPVNAMTTALGTMVTSGGTAAISALSVRCYQTYDDLAIVNPPILAPRFRTTSQPITQAVVDSPFYIRSSVPLRGFVVMTDTATLGEDETIITGFRHLDDLRTYVGDRDANWLDMVNMQAIDFGGTLGNLNPNPDAYWFQNYQDGGRLSQIYNPERAGTNLRVEITGAPSVAVGAGASTVYAGIIELNKIEGRTTVGFPWPTGI